MSGVSMEPTGTHVPCPVCGQEIEADVYVLHSERHDAAGELPPPADEPTE